MSVQLRVCAVNSVGMGILNNTTLQVAIIQDGSYCIICGLSCC